MKSAALIVVAGAACLAVGCGFGAKPSADYTTAPATTQGSATLTFTAPTTLTVAQARTGAPVSCTNRGISAGAEIPAPGHGVSGSADGKSGSATLELTRNGDGSLVVSCTP